MVADRSLLISLVDYTQKSSFIETGDQIVDKFRMFHNYSTNDGLTEVLANRGVASPFFLGRDQFSAAAGMAAS